MFCLLCVQLVGHVVLKLVSVLVCVFGGRGLVGVGFVFVLSFLLHLH